MTWEQKYRRLVEAIRAYADGLRLHGALGERWTDEAPDLDRLWGEVLTAAGLETEDSE